MPRVPVPSFTASVPKVGVSPTPVAHATAGPDTFGQFTEAVAALSNRLEDQENTRQLTELETSALDQLDQLQEKVLSDPDHATAVSRFETGSSDIIAKLAATARNRKVGDTFRLNAERRAVLAKGQVRAKAFARSREAMQLATTQMFEQTIKTYGEADNDLDRFLAISRAKRGWQDATAAGAYETQEEADRLWSSFMTKAEQGRVLSMIQRQDFAAAAEYIEKSKVLTSEDKIQLENTRASEQSQAHNAMLDENERAVVDLAIRVSRGEASYAEVRAMRDVMPPRRYEQLIEELDANKEVGREAQKLDLMVGNAMNRVGPPLDPGNKDHRDAVDRRWRNNEADLAASERSPLDILDHGRELITRTGIVPETLKNSLVGWLRGEDADMAVNSANFINDILQRNPRISDAFDPKEREFAVMMGNLSSGGMSSEDAFRVATDVVYKVDSVTKETRARQWKEGDYEADVLGNFSSHLGDLFPGAGGAFGPDFLFGGPAQHEEVKTQYLQFVRAHFQATGNIDAAMKLADQDVKRRWGLTEVGGEQRVVLLPPELAYGTGRGDAEWMQEQLVMDTIGALDRGHVIVDEQVVTDFAGQDRATLLGERLSLEVLPETARSDRPLYGVWMSDEYGNRFPILDDTGRQLQWHPEYASSAENERVQADVQARKEEGLSRAERLKATGRTGMMAEVTAGFRKSMGIPLEGLGNRVPERPTAEGPMPEAEVKTKAPTPSVPATATKADAPDANMIEAIIWVESRGRTDAVSPVGALGPAQIMPKTARDPGFGVDPVKDPTDPQQARKFVRQYMGAMLKRYGNLEDALRAYNWGVGNVDRWIAGGRVDPMPQETIDYVERVTNRMRG